MCFGPKYYTNDENGFNDCLLDPKWWNCRIAFGFRSGKLVCAKTCLL